MSTQKSLSIEDVQKQLPYVPPEKILEALSNTQKYLPTNAGKYLPVGKVKFDVDE